jgi:hypothetical protein
VTTALSAVVPRVRATVAGRIIAVRAYLRPWMRLDVELGDGTGTIILRFIGRAAVPGMSPGRRVGAEGMPSAQGAALVMLNPHYAFVVDDVVVDDVVVDHDHAKQSSGDDHEEQSSDDEGGPDSIERSGGGDALPTDRRRSRPRPNSRGMAGHPVDVPFTRT